ncbi:AbrB/MazE/SpoVT family DNA-binding domain-containing protein [Kitasatospora sp. NPDC057542]|uniref:AbrB/MazE/SpoVT family DNA-binding domain-containing protein n=1 Tax=Kitasatospora sp. NPDC057542 TaxID=3346162 RepID=UPI0036BF40AD
MDDLNTPTRSKVGPRGRLTIPVALQRAAGITEGEEVVLRVVAPGVFTVESVQAVKDRLRGSFARRDRPTDIVAEIRAERDREESEEWSDPNNTGADRRPIGDSSPP